MTPQLIQTDDRIGGRRAQRIQSPRFEKFRQGQFERPAIEILDTRFKTGNRLRLDICVARVFFRRRCLRKGLGREKPYGNGVCPRVSMIPHESFSLYVSLEKWIALRRRGRLRGFWCRRSRRRCRGFSSRSAKVCRRIALKRAGCGCRCGRQWFGCSGSDCLHRSYVCRGSTWRNGMNRRG